MLQAYSALTKIFYTVSSWCRNFSSAYPVHVVTIVAWHRLHPVNKNNRRFRHSHHPIQIPRILELKASCQHLQVHPWQWHCYHPAFLSLAQPSLKQYLFLQYMVGQSVPSKKCVFEVPERKINFMNIIPSSCLEQLCYSCLLFMVKFKQSQS